MLQNLKINWEFNQTRYHDFLTFFLNFSDKNREIEYCLIPPDIYYFILNFNSENLKFKVNTLPLDKLSHLMYFVHFNVAIYLIRNNITEPLKFIRFKETSERNTFLIDYRY